MCAPAFAEALFARACQVAITVPGDNSVDIFTNDLGIVVISDEAGEVQGYNLLVGGGMGRTARSGSLRLFRQSRPLCRCLTRARM